MVVAVCKGCGTKHWIADNLDPVLVDNNIEEYFNAKGEPDMVSRVNEDVYEIERVWNIRSGQISDENGESVLE